MYLIDGIYVHFIIIDHYGTRFLSLLELLHKVGIQCGFFSLQQFGQVTCRRLVLVYIHTSPTHASLTSTIAWGDVVHVTTMARSSCAEIS